MGKWIARFLKLFIWNTFLLGILHTYGVIPYLNEYFFIVLNSLAITGIALHLFVLAVAFLTLAVDRYDYYVTLISDTKAQGISVIVFMTTLLALGYTWGVVLLCLLYYPAWYIRFSRVK